MGPKPDTWRSKAMQSRWWLALGLVVAGAASLSQFGTLRLVPPSFHPRSPSYSTASTSILVSAGPQGRHASNSYSLGQALDAHTLTLGEIVGSPTLRARIAADAGVRTSQLAIDAALWTQLQRVQVWDTGPKRSVQILVEHDLYRLTLTDNAYQPIIYVSAQGPTAAKAARLAGALTTALGQFIEQAQDAAHISPADRYGVSQLAPIVVAGGKPSQEINLALLVFVSVFVVWWGIVLAASRLRDDLRGVATGAEDREPNTRWFFTRRRRRMAHRTETADV